MSSESDLTMVGCPYDNTHRMRRNRLQQHLIKCRINYPDVEVRPCPFNQSHLIPEPEFVLHASKCPDRKLITQYKYEAPEIIDEVVKQTPIECEENWDDTEVEDYNPQKYIQKANVLRKPDGLFRSQRKEFAKQESKRLRDCDGDVSPVPSPPPPPVISNWHVERREHKQEIRQSRFRSRSPPIRYSSDE